MAVTKLIPERLGTRVCARHVPRCGALDGSTSQSFPLALVSTHQSVTRKWKNKASVEDIRHSTGGGLTATLQQSCLVCSFTIPFRFCTGI